jgi:hypothetical protein
MHRYFGEKMRNRLDNTVGSSFVTLGGTMEQWWKTGMQPATTQSNVEAQLRNLSNLVYGFNLEMIRAIQGGAIGSLVQKDRRQRSEQ